VDDGFPPPAVIANVRFRAKRRSPVRSVEAMTEFDPSRTFRWSACFAVQTAYPGRVGLAIKNRFWIAGALSCGLASGGAQFALLAGGTSSQRDVIAKAAWGFGLAWLLLSLLAVNRLGRRGWWAFVPAPLALAVPLAAVWLLVACTVTYCDM